MKRQLFLIFTLLFASLCTISGQSFLRYHMSDSTYNGFYTENIDSIRHELNGSYAIASVFTNNGKRYDIELDKVDSITIERALVDDGDVGQYRIYQISNDTGTVKTILADNRASLFASCNGDFGANDTILFSSAFNEVTWIFFTDSQGRIKKFFDGNKLLYFDYDSDSEFTIFDLSENESKHYSVKKRKEAKGYRAFSISFFSNIYNSGFENFIGDVCLNRLGNIASNFAQNINDVANNPELHNQSFIVDGLSIAGDIIGIGASLLGEAPTLGWSTAGLMLSTGSLINNWTNLLNHLWPNSEQMDRYKEYYQNKYGITVKTINPENVKSNKADLRGTFMSYNGIKGDLYFTIYKLADTGMGDRITGSPEALTSNSYIVKGSATSLKPGTNYFYVLWYECEVDGLHFSYPADNAIDFTTPKLSATTIGTESVSDKTAVVKCSFSNVPENAICGVQYGHAGNYYIASTSSSDGEKEINLTGLEPSSTYSYRAFIQYDGENYYGETKSFTTKVPGISGTWNVVETYSTRPFPGAEWQTKTREYSITLNENGSIQISGLGYEYIAGSWGYGDGGFSATGHIIATQAQNSWDRFEGKVDDVKSPQKITGTRYRGNMNQITSVENAVGSIVMTR